MQDFNSEQDRLLTTREAAAMLDVSPQTLEVWRSTRRYPLPYLKIGHNVRYRKSGVLEFISAGQVSA